MNIKVRSKKSIIISLELDEVAARWLKDYCQNDLLGGNETREERNYRHEVFNGIKNQLNDKPYLIHDERDEAPF